MWALMVAATWSWWSGLESQRCLSAGRELRALSVGQNMVNGRCMDILSKGSNPEFWPKKTQRRSVLESLNLAPIKYLLTSQKLLILQWAVKTQNNRSLETCKRWRCGWRRWQSGRCSSRRRWSNQTRSRNSLLIPWCTDVKVIDTPVYGQFEDFLYLHKVVETGVAMKHSGRGDVHLKKRTERETGQHCQRGRSKLSDWSSVMSLPFWGLVCPAACKVSTACRCGEWCR